MRINYTNSCSKACQVERTVYGFDEAKIIERKLRADTHEAEQENEIHIRIYIPVRRKGRLKS